MIGSIYKETIEELKGKIRNNNIRILDEKDFEDLVYFEPVCYFCRKSINGNIRILVDSDPKGQIKRNYPIDSRCYAKAKGLEVIY